MMNLLKSDLYRLRRNKTLFGGIILCLFFVCFTVYVFTESDGLYLLMRHINGIRYGFFIENVKNNATLFGFYQSFIGFTILYCIIQLFLVTNLTVDRYRLGIFKNTLSYGHSRVSIYLSNLITIFVSIFVLFSITLISSTLIWSFTAFPSFSISSAELQIILKTTPVLLLVLFAMASIYTFLSTLMKQKTIIVGIGILYFVYLSGIFAQLLPPTALSRIPLFMIMNLCGSLVESQSQLGYYAWVSGLIIAITSGLGILIFKKQELK